MIPLTSECLRYGVRSLQLGIMDYYRDPKGHTRQALLEEQGGRADARAIASHGSILWDPFECSGLYDEAFLKRAPTMPPNTFGAAQ